METVILKPINGRKSLGNKAVLLIDEKYIKLNSYETIVAVYNKKTKKIVIRGYYSQTTFVHINCFLDYLGLPVIDKKELERKYLSLFTKDIQRIDVQKVADSIKMKITEEDIDFVMLNYDLVDDNTASFELIVDNLLYDSKKQLRWKKSKL
ncbi:MAG: hypothetical protein KA278_00270 [Flavobacterium sp.]|nr:hypothetical protein [Flavobacterium sp.]